MRITMPSTRILRRLMTSCLVGLIGGVIVASVFESDAATEKYKIVIFGSVDDAIAFWKKAEFWGEEERGEELIVPRAITVAINKSWKKEAEQVSVGIKKELFYRALVPVILYANELIGMDRRRLESMRRRHLSGETLSEGELSWLRAIAKKYRIPGFQNEEKTPTKATLLSFLDALLIRVDIIPPSLALGQGAYESGYGTSRFTLFGNALFGQWTYGGRGLKPKQHRKSKGNYKVSSYDWPFDSVWAYMRNLNTHRSYREFRQKRAYLRRRSRNLSGPVLADTLTKYSEIGKSYTKTLKAIIKKNGLEVADNARLADGPMVLIVNAETAKEVPKVQAEIDRLRTSGELAKIIKEMRLDGD